MAYRASSLRGLAIAQTVFGALMFVFGIASIAAVDHWISSIGFGIWIGVWVSNTRDFEASLRLSLKWDVNLILSFDQEHDATWKLGLYSVYCSYINFYETSLTLQYELIFSSGNDVAEISR